MSRLRRRRVKSYRFTISATLSALVIAAACGSNPELALTNGDVVGGAELGEPCDLHRDCAADLRCGADGVCERSCGDLDGNGCGAEACLPDGNCSEGLGDSCQNDKSCSEGLVCSGFKRCSVPCEPGEEGVCKDSKVCRDDGTCPTDKDLDLGMGGAGGDEPPLGTGGSGSCIDVEVNFEPQVPTVLLLIDQSGSMNAAGFGDAVADAVADGTYTLGNCPDRMMNNQPVSTNDWRWNVVREVLFNPDTGIIKPLEDNVRFGLSLYSSTNGQVNTATQNDLEDYDTTKMCPTLVEVPIALGNHQAMFDEFACSDIKDDTPTGESLLAAAMTLQAFDEPGPKVIVLATDGEPDNCECPDFTDNMPAKCQEAGLPAQIKADVVATAEQIYGDDITIHVINVSTPGQAGLQQHLEEVAAAGGGEVYPGFSPGDLATAFEEIIDGTRSCIIDLDGEIAEGKEDTGTVTLDGEPLELDGDDGWQVNSPSQIELLGAACETIKSGDHDLQIEFPCESFDPDVH
jgi:hypothetical protein